MQKQQADDLNRLVYEPPPPRRRMRIALITGLLGGFCLFLEVVNELVTIVPSKAAEASRWEAGYLFLFLGGLLVGISVGICVARPRT